MDRRLEARRGEESPEPTEIETELERILASDSFARAGRSSAFLRFVVEEALAGRSKRIKGYTIGVEVFGRGTDFDAQSDPLVRVEAGRLRHRLADYYLNEGRGNPLRIELSKGGYRPIAHYAEPQPAMPEAGSGLPSLVSNRLAVLTGIAATLVIAGLLAWFSPADHTPKALPELSSTTDAAGTPPLATSASARSLLPRMIVLPITNLNGGASVEAFAGGLTEEVIRALVSFDIVSTAGRPNGVTGTPPLAELREAYDADYALTGSVRTAGDVTRVAMRLVDTRDGTQLWTRSFDAGLVPGGALATEEEMARTIAMVLATPYGPVFAREIELIADKPATELDPYECVLRFYSYARSFDPGEHADAGLCLRRTVAAVPDFAVAWSSLAVIYLHEYSFGYNPQPDRGDPLLRALESVRRSLDLDGSGRVAAITLAGIERAMGDTEAFARASDRALAMRPTHPAVRAQIGFLRTLSGDWQHGLPLIDEAIPVTTNVPGWYFVAHSFARLQEGDPAGALDWSLRIDAPTWFVAPLVVAATAALAGRDDLAARELERLRSLYPDIESTGREQLERWGLDERILRPLLDGLSLAGLRMS
jgi:adenylate cyclase